MPMNYASYVKELEADIARMETQLGIMREMLKYSRAMIEALPPGVMASGMTETARQILREAPAPMRAPEIWRACKARGVTTRAKDPVATIYSALMQAPGVKRMGKGKQTTWTVEK